MQQKLILSLAVVGLLLWGSQQPLHGGSWLDAAGRVLLVGFFVVAGICNLTREQIKAHIDYMTEVRTPFPAAAFWTGIVLQITGCALVLAGWHPAIGVTCLIVFIVAATVIFHRFWEMKDPMRRNFARLFLLNNVAILGGLLLYLDRLPR